MGYEERQMLIGLHEKIDVLIEGITTILENQQKEEPKKKVKTQKKEEKPEKKEETPHIFDNE